VGVLALATMLGLFLPALPTFTNGTSREPIIKSGYVVAIVHVVAAIGLLAIIATILFAMP